MDLQKVQIVFGFFYIYSELVVTFKRFYHCAIDLFKSLQGCHDAHIQWPIEAERFQLCNCRCGFQFAINGVKATCWRPSSEPKQTKKYDGHHKKQCNAALVWIDVHRLLIRLYFKTMGLMHDNKIFNHADSFVRRTEYFYWWSTRSWRHRLRLTWACGLSIQANQGHHDPDSLTHNKNTRTQRWLNEHAIGYLSNKFRCFLGRSSWREENWELSLRHVAMTCIYVWRISESRLLETQRRFCERLDDEVITSVEIATFLAEMHFDL